MDLPVPILKINGVPLDCETFAWPFAAGTVSPRVGFEVSNEVDQALRTMSNPVTFFADITAEDEGQAVRSVYEVRELYLGERQRVDPWTVRWTLSDARSLYMNVRVTAHFNMPRIMNETIVPSFVNAGAGNFDAAAANPDTNGIARYKYKPVTLRGEGKKFATPRPGTKTAGSVWTALEAIEYLISVVNARHRGRKIKYRIEAGDNKFELQGEAVTEERFPYAMARLMNLARVSMFPDCDGTWVFYSIQDEPLRTKVGGFEGAGVAEVKDISRVIPASVALRFPPLHETRWDYIEGYGETVGVYDFRLENVLQLPETVGSKNRGTWVTIAEALELWNADTAHPWGNGRSMTIADVRKLSTSNALMASYAFQPQGGLNEVLVGRIVALVSSYRQVFRIPSVWMDLIEHWEPFLVNLVDTVTAQPQPSPVWQDYTIIPTARMPRGQSAPPAARKLTAVQRAWPLGTGEKPPLSTGTVAPFDLAIVSQELGIFRTVPKADHQRYVVQYLPSALAQDVKLDLARSAPAAQLILESTPFATDFHLATLISVVFATPNDSSRFHEVRTNAGGAKGAPVSYDYFFTREPARLAWQDGKSTALIDSKTGTLKLEGWKLINEKALKAVSQAYFNRLAFSYMGRIQGVFKKVGFDPRVDRPRGNVKSVTTVFDGSSGSFDSIYDMSEPPDPPDLKELLDPETRRIIYRELERPR